MTWYFYFTSGTNHISSLRIKRRLLGKISKIRKKVENLNKISISKWKIVATS